MRQQLLISFILFNSDTVMKHEYWQQYGMYDGQICFDLWQNQILGMAMATVVIPGFLPMVSQAQILHIWPFNSLFRVLPWFKILPMTMQWPLYIIAVARGPRPFTL